VHKAVVIGKTMAMFFPSDENMTGVDSQEGSRFTDLKVDVENCIYHQKVDRTGLSCIHLFK
jgi:hypothetical protein